MTRHLVVIDERNRFALHVWRYLSRSLGYGTGRVSATGDHNEGDTWIRKAEPLSIAHMDTKLWWVPPDSECLGAIDRVFEEEPWSDQSLVIVDMRGDAGSWNQHRQILCHLKDVGLTIDRIFPVSAFYPSQRVFRKDAEEPLRIWPKTSDTLRQIRNRLIEEDSSLKDDDRCHILVTGAGFEIRGKKGGFGLPKTATLLNNMGPPFFVRKKGVGHGGVMPADAIELRPQEESFPVPSNENDDLIDAAEDHDLIDAAEDHDLDMYWNLLLEDELKSLKWSEMESAVDRENSMREAFRRTMRNHDWGYLNQSLCAARLDWHTWLTTNYTHFANRSIALAQSRQQENDRGRPWSIVSTSSEALVAMRRVFGQASPVQNGIEDLASKNADPQPGQRYLFKLHGDIAHLNTMAIAGYDKLSFSPLTAPVDSLYQIYTAAEKHLETTLKKLDPHRRIVWHIVGHGLHDIQLRGLMKNVVEHVGNRDRHTFRIVNLKPCGPRERLLTYLEGNGAQADGLQVSIELIRCEAADYLDLLYENGLGKDFEEYHVCGDEDR